MGTNYYLETDLCPHCGRPEQTFHIGKSSAGWKFLFQKYNFISSIDDMKRFLNTGIIKSEYGKEISQQDFWEMVERKQSEKGDDLYSIYIDEYNFHYGDFC